MNVCMIIAKFTPHLGGLEKQALELSRTLVKGRIGVFVITRKYLRNVKSYENIDGVNVIPIPFVAKDQI